MAAVSEILGYAVLSTLGYGARSTIFAVKDKDHQVYALKRVVMQSPADQRYLDQAILEHEVASRFNHPTLRKSLKLIKQRALIRTNEVYVLMELVDGPTLEQHKPPTLVQSCRLMQQVTQGLGAMHEAGFVHADIKPNNILVIDDEKVKIIDFGQSCKIGTIKERIQGTPDYIAPEQVLRQQITPLTDVFNLGATMYWLLTGNHIPTMIPKGTPGLTLRSDHDEPKSPREINPTIPAAISTLVIQCVKKEPAQRPQTMREVCDRLEIGISQFKRSTSNGHS